MGNTHKSNSHIPSTHNYDDDDLILCGIGPRGNVHVSNGEIFIPDTRNHRVRKVLGNGQLVTIAGTGTKGYSGDGQLATEVQLYSPTCVVVSSLNQVYISDADNNRIRKIDARGVISTIAGNGLRGYDGDGRLAVDAELNHPRGGLFVNDDEEVYFCDFGNHCVRKIDRFGKITTVAGNVIPGYDGGYNGDDILATSAHLYFPTNVFVYKNEIYITDTFNHRIRKVLQNGIITTIAGTGEYGYNGDDQPATSAHLNQPQGLFVYNDQVYFSDYYNNRVRMILPNGMIKTIAGTGKRGYNGEGMLAAESPLDLVSGIFVDDSGIYMAEYGSSRIRKIDSNGIITTIAGTGKEGYSGDVPFDFEKYPHIGPKKKQFIKPLPKTYHDVVIHCQNSFDTGYELPNKEVKY